MKTDDPVLLELNKELEELKRSERNVEYLHYAQRIIGQYDRIESLVKKLPDSLKEKYIHPYKLTDKETEFKIIKSGFQKGDLVLRIVNDDNHQTLRIEKNGDDLTNTFEKRTANIKLIKAFATEIEKLCKLFERRLKEEIVQAQKELERKIEEF
jgi:vacuolar-type H+-ATPase subunit I/STV1